ncbi:hypothetical protein Mp_7g16960 [Marchantia polymorpha subsp. ruderalis]|uniref:Uncharacterized protein n=2 Tax=Marchantia polymorpha TaxID=3197 RepID=A0AAF6C0L6_MARPO|nr:hypothetical protein MARPO_0051s0034 [Marchantia polymorpha]BBN17800.1 hypothetical protein Mp_7g16960 [Marchantia polymorpha subsp. ruderalis]|eukprot:PTQ38414.1 hypothetical protein MARPO_0051s0034 [Marchantia polymorpha]
MERGLNGKDGGEERRRQRPEHGLLKFQTHAISIVWQGLSFMVASASTARAGMPRVGRGSVGPGHENSSGTSQASDRSPGRGSHIVVPTFSPGSRTVPPARPTAVLGAGFPLPSPPPPPPPRNQPRNRRPMLNRTALGAASARKWKMRHEARDGRAPGPEEERLEREALSRCRPRQSRARAKAKKETETSSSQQKEIAGPAAPAPAAGGPRQQAKQASKHRTQARGEGREIARESERERERSSDGTERSGGSEGGKEGEI